MGRLISRYLYTYPLSVLLIAAIWILCMVPRVENPIPSIHITDKWAHMLMYAVLCMTIWTEYYKKHKKLNRKKLFLFSFLAPIIMGGLVEIAQGTLTHGNRNADWLDFFANSIGVCVGCITGTLEVIVLSTWRKDAPADENCRNADCQ